ncbi:hypothetical protein GCG21_11465 [Pseudactinotalea sp. HY160]|uniref:hypothetical protein n=1 Tax=Pseudactinotalea sp. HY160 TaxID=2654490 RepID=UPI00128B03E4|nr:hypothetical protein [Pseudactinotalea sp. HY160]MPV50611.1 hypothetical protein [Pseudactinotalea sp. HY160]
MTTATRNRAGHEPAPVPAVAGYRSGFDTAQRWLALLGVVLCALQIGFAALGFWGAQAAGGGEDATRAAFAPHGELGTVLGYLALLVLVTGLLARSGWKSWVIPLVLAVLLFAVQGMLVGLGFEVSRWFGFVHALSGTVITAGFVWLMLDRFRAPLR